MKYYELRIWNRSESDIRIGEATVSRESPETLKPQISVFGAFFANAYKLFQHSLPCEALASFAPTKVS